MAYRVGMQCLESFESAQDLIMSQVPPSILQDGSIVRPEKIGSNWFLNGNQIILSFPECSLSEQFFLGAKVGVAFICLFTIVVLFAVLFKMINSISERD